MKNLKISLNKRRNKIDWCFMFGYLLRTENQVEFKPEMQRKRQRADVGGNRECVSCRENFLFNKPMEQKKLNRRLRYKK